MSRSIIMRGYIPEYLRGSRIITAVLAVAGTEMDRLTAAQQEALEQLFVPTATGWGLSRWEETLGLPIHAGKPDEQRRSRIISKLRGVGTVTAALIKNVAESYTYGTAEVDEHPESYGFTVTFADRHGIPPNYEDLQAALAEIKPAHLRVDYLIRYLLWNELDAEALTWDHLDAKNLTWDEFELGGWLDA